MNAKHAIWSFVRADKKTQMLGGTPAVKRSEARMDVGGTAPIAVAHHWHRCLLSICTILNILHMNKLVICLRQPKANLHPHSQVVWPVLCPVQVRRQLEVTSK